MIWWATCSQFRTPRHVSSPESGGASTSRQLHWLPVRRWVDFKISTLVYRSLAGSGTASVYQLTNVRWSPPLTAILYTVCWQSNVPGQEITQPVWWTLFCNGRATRICLNGFGNWTSPSDNSNDRWKRLCLVSWAAAPCAWTLRALTRNLLTYWLTLTFDLDLKSALLLPVLVSLTPSPELSSVFGSWWTDTQTDGRTRRFRTIPMYYSIQRSSIFITKRVSWSSVFSRHSVI